MTRHQRLVHNSPLENAFRLSGSNQRTGWQNPDTFLIGNMNTEGKENLWGRWEV